MIICNSRRYAFIHLHKTGGSSFEIAAEPTLAWNDLLLGSTKTGEMLHEYYMQRYGLNKHSSLSEILKVCSSADVSSYRYLTIVRHPVKRAISLYRFIGTLVNNFCDSKNITLNKVHEEYEVFKSKYWPLCWPASEAYVMTKGDISGFFFHHALERELAMKPQFTQVSIDGQIPSQLKFIKLEELSQADSILKDFTGVQLKIPHENKSTTKTIAISDLSKPVKEHLRSRFEEDLCNFDYQ